MKFLLVSLLLSLISIVQNKKKNVNKQITVENEEEN